MSLIKNIEIDTLKLRSLIVRDSKNNPVSEGFQLYANGDGTTYWSSGVNAQQFINLSSFATATNSTLTNFVSSASSTLSNLNSTSESLLLSTINSVSSYVASANTIAMFEQYADAGVQNYSSMLGSTLVNTYQTIESSITLFNSSLENTSTTAASIYSTLDGTTIIEANNLSSVKGQIYSSIAYTSSLIVSTNAQIAFNSTITTSTLFGNLSTYTVSSFAAVAVVASTNFGVSNSLILANVAYTVNSLATLSTSQGQVVSSISFVPVALTSTLSATSTLIAQGQSTSYVSSVNYTNRAISTLFISTTTTISTVRSTIESNIVSSVSSLNNLRIVLASTVASTIQNVSTSIGSTLLYFEQNITVLLSTGLTQNIYQTFLDLQAYSASTISGTTSTGNFVINSTNTALEQQNVSSYNGLLDSTFLYVTKNLYQSTISTVIPASESTINASITSSNAYFNQIIISTTQYYQLLVNATYVAFTEDVAAFTTASEQQISTQIAQGLSTQESILSTAIILNNNLLNQALSTNVFGLSSFTYSQYTTAPSIIMNKVSNLSTLSNVGSVTGLSSLVASLITLDTTNYNNFYILVSDIGANIYYGLVLSTSQAKINQEFTIQIDIKSTYQNSFFTLDTSNLSNWLGTPKMYNPNSFSLITDVSNRVPKPDSVEQVYISTFIGAYVIDMKYTPMGMFIRNVYTYPFIYSNASFSGAITVPANVQVANAQLAAHSTFVYRGTPIQISWQTNDLNIPMGVKFTGVDINGNQITNWAGPYVSALGTASVKVPTPPASFARYDMMYLGVYPNTPRLDNTTAGNAQSQIFSSRPFPSSLYVVNPTINTYIRVLNPGTVNGFLQVGEIVINNDVGKNMTQVSTNCIFKPDNYNANINTFPYNGSYSTFGEQYAFDGNVSTYFYGGYSANQPNLNAYVGGQFSTISSFSQLPQSSLQISSIQLFQGPLYSLQNMQLVMSNRNEANISDGLFFSTITLISSYSQSYSFC